MNEFTYKATTFKQHCICILLLPLPFLYLPYSSTSISLYSVLYCTLLVVSLCSSLSKTMDLSSSSTLFSTYQIHFFTATLTFVLSALVLVFSFKSAFWKKKSNLPPGPPGWPVVGNLFQVARSGKQFFDYVHDLVPKYGSIFTLKMGARTLVIISSPEIAHEALIQKGQLFANRGPENPTRTIFSANKFTVNAAFYGPVWRSLRRNMVQNMLTSTRLKEFVALRNSAMDKLVAKIKTEAEDNGGLVWVLRNARFAAFSILIQMCLGAEMAEEEIQKIDDMMKTVLVVLNPRLDDYLPLLRPFFSKQRMQALQVRKRQLETLIPYIERRRSILQNPQKLQNDDVVSFSYLDTLFDLKIDGRKDGPSDEELVTLCSEFLNGGTDTTGTAIEWAIARLIENPGIQTTLYEEIKSTVGDKRVDEKDVEKMPYLIAVVKELLRKHPPTSFTLTHTALEPTTLAGYDITPDINVEFYLPGIGNDPKTWPNPEPFDPERFLTGGQDADMTGVTAIKMIPFGAGRRICPGLGMGTIHVHLMLARLVQEFEWMANPDSPKIDFAGKLEFTVVMKNPLRPMVKPRV